AMFSRDEAATAFFEGREQIGLESLERGNETEQDPGSDRDRNGKEQDASVQRDFLSAGNGTGDEVKRGLLAPYGDKQTERGTEAGEQDTFGKQLAEHAGGAGSDRRTNREFAAASHGASQRKIGDIDAGDQQDESDSGHEKKQE